MTGIIGAIRSIILWITGKSAPRPVDMPDEVPSTGEPKWLVLARGELGVKEEPGAANNPTVLRYYRDAGHPEIDNDATAWCAAFVGAMLERSGNPSSKSLMARSYLQWGKAVEKPYPGCIVVFSRGDPRSPEGHVALWLGEDEKGVRCLGGNQGDAVSIAYEPKSRVLGYRTPVTASNSRSIKAASTGIIAAGVGSSTILQSQSDLFGIANTMKELGVSMPALAIGAQVLTIALFCVVIHARYTDLQEKGR